MSYRSAFFAACCFAATACSALLAGCNSAESRAREAYSAYEAATAAGNPQAARSALLRLVAADDSVAAYWEELGKLHIQLGDHERAYYAFSRAHELDRDNVQVLSSLTQLALLAGNTDAAERHAEELELLAPQDPAVKLAYGYVALRGQRYDEAEKQADAILEVSPFDSRAKLLKARVYSAQGELETAIALLEEQLRMNSGDIGALRGLIAIHERMGNWRGVASAAERLWRLNPDNRESALTVVDAALRSRDVETARRVSAELLRPETPARDVGPVLEIWAQRWKSPDAVAEAERLARAAPRSHRLAYATYFNEAGRPEEAAALVGVTPQLPLQVTNLSTNAVIAGTLATGGRVAEAKKLLDAILAREPDHVYALRSRVNVQIRTGQTQAAIDGAQRLVSIVPTSVRDRLLLARAYAAAGDARQVDRTLWDAFHEIPANLELYETLRAHVQRTRGPEVAKAVDAEFQQQRDMQLAREFI